MSTIPDGLRADLMRARMEDKATIIMTGGLYVGGTTQKTYYNNDGTTVTGYETECLTPGASGLPLVSNGEGAKPSYRQITGSAIQDGSITGNCLGAGTIQSVDPTQQYKIAFSVSNSVLDITFLPVTPSTIPNGSITAEV